MLPMSYSPPLDRIWLKKESATVIDKAPKWRTSANIWQPWNERFMQFAKRKG